MKQSSDLKAPWAKGFSSATRETDMLPAPLETWGMRGGPGPVSDLPHLGLPTGAPLARACGGQQPTPTSNDAVEKHSPEAHLGFLCPVPPGHNHICD